MNPEKQHHTCPKCGAKWLCVEGKECASFIYVQCPCEVCRPSEECKGCRPITMMDKEKVMFT